VTVTPQSFVTNPSSNGSDLSTILAVPVLQSRHGMVHMLTC